MKSSQVDPSISVTKIVNDMQEGLPQIGDDTHDEYKKARDSIRANSMQTRRDAISAERVKIRLATNLRSDLCEGENPNEAADRRSETAPWSKEYPQRQIGHTALEPEMTGLPLRIIDSEVRTIDSEVRITPFDLQINGPSEELASLAAKK